MDWRAKVERFEEIRREYEFGVGTIAGVARKVGAHRRMVREAVASASAGSATRPLGRNQGGFDTHSIRSIIYV